MPVYKAVILSIIYCICSKVSQGQWVRPADTRAISIASAQDIDLTGSVYTSGILTCNTIFETDTLFNNSCAQDSLSPVLNSQLDMFLSKHDPTGNLIWVSQIIGSQHNSLFINDLKVDATGNTYVLGDFMDSLFVSSNDTLVNLDTLFNGFLVKFLPDGTTDWALHLGEIDSAFVSTSHLDLSTNEIVLTGTFRGKLTIGSDMDSVVDNSMFLASFDLVGTPNWMINSVEGEVGSTGFGKAVEILGDSIYTLVEFGDSIVFGLDTLRIPRPPNRATALTIFHRVDGSLLWHKLLNTPTINNLTISQTDSSLYLAGASTDSTFIETDTLFTAFETRAFVSSHTFSGNLKWALAIRATDITDLEALDVSVGTDDQVFATGVFRGTQVTAGAFSDTNSGDQDVFLVKLDSAGSVSWVQSVGGMGDDEATVISAFNQNTVFGAGFFTGSIRVAGDLLTTEGGRNGFIAQYDKCPEVMVEMLSGPTEYVCENEQFTFQATDDPGYAYTWFKGDVTIPGAVSSSYTTDEPAIYVAEIDDGSGCIKKTLSSQLTLNPLPESTISPKDSLTRCAGDSLEITGPVTVDTFQWFELASGPLASETMANVKLGTSGDYFLRVTSDSLCISYSDTLQVSVLNYPDSTLNLAGKQVICGGDNVVLEAENDASYVYEWYKDDLLLPAENTFQLLASASGIYHGIVRNSIGCQSLTNSDTVVVQSAPLIDLNDEAIGPILCDGDSIKIVTTHVVGQMYQWRDNGMDIPGETTNSLKVRTGGDYSVFVQNANCDDISDVVGIALVSPPAAAITNTTGETICEGESFELQANTGLGLSYQWKKNDIAITGASAPTHDAMEAGSYAVEVTNSSGCITESGTVAININLAPLAFIAPQGATTVCDGDQVQLKANAGTDLSYQWYRNGLLLTGEININLITSESGEYSVAVNNVNDCMRLSDSEQVTIVPIPMASIASVGAPLICERDSLELQASQDVSLSHAWLKDGLTIDGEDQSFLFVTEAGDYQTIASIGTCRDTSAVLAVNVVNNTIPDIDRNDDFLSTALFGEFQWFRNGEAIVEGQEQIYRVEEDGFYQVQVINNNGCAAISDSMSVCIPIPTLTRDNDQITVDLADRDYQWLFEGIPISGAVAQTITVQQSGNYSALVTEQSGCTMATSALMACIPFPFITQDELTGVLFANPSPASQYLWFLDSMALQNEDLNVLIPIGAGVYQVKVTDFEDCTSISEGFMIESITGVDELNMGLKVYPNPVTNSFRVEFNDQKVHSVNLRVFNIKGDIVLRQKYYKDQEYDIGHLPAGLYMLVVERKQEQFIVQIQKN